MIKWLTEIIPQRPQTRWLARAYFSVYRSNFSTSTSRGSLPEQENNLDANMKRGLRSLKKRVNMWQLHIMPTFVGKFRHEHNLSRSI